MSVISTENPVMACCVRMHIVGLDTERTAMCVTNRNDRKEQKDVQTTSKNR